MNLEEDQQIEQLLNPDSKQKQQSASIKWFSQFFEEDYILDLPRSKASLDALKKFAGRPDTPSTLKKQAEKLCKKYKN